MGDLHEWVAMLIVFVLVLAVLARVADSIEDRQSGRRDARSRNHVSRR